MVASGLVLPAVVIEVIAVLVTVAPALTTSTVWSATLAFSSPVVTLESMLDWGW